MSRACVSWEKRTNRPSGATEMVIGEGRRIVLYRGRHPRWLRCDSDSSPRESRGSAGLFPFSTGLVRFGCWVCPASARRSCLCSATLPVHFVNPIHPIRRREQLRAQRGGEMLGQRIHPRFLLTDSQISNRGLLVQSYLGVGPAATSVDSGPAMARLVAAVPEPVATDRAGSLPAPGVSRDFLREPGSHPALSTIS